MKNLGTALRFARANRAVVAAFALALMLTAVLPCPAATLTVDSTADDGSPGTLRAVLASAMDGDTIDISATGTIALTGGQLVVDKNLTVTGAGQEQLTVDGQQVSRVFYIAPGKTVAISHLTIANGNAGHGRSGGGIWNAGELTLGVCTLTNNEAAQGGAVFNEGTLTLYDCTLSNNTAVGRYDEWDPDFNFYGSGGAIFVSSVNEVSLTLDSCTLSDNSASGEVTGGGGLGGAIAIGIVAYLHDQTGAHVIIRNSTFTGNFAVGYGSGAAGAISNVKGSLTIDNSTLAGNYDDWADPLFQGSGAILNLLGSLKIKNTILANDESPTNLLSLAEGTEEGFVTLPIDDLGYNLCSDDCNGLLDGQQSNLLYADPLLGALQDNGGPTWTLGPLAGSPAIDAAAETDSAGNGVAFDQRGVARPQGTANDIGAVEVEQATGNGPPTADPGGPYLAAVNALFAADGGASSDPDGDSLNFTWAFDNSTETGSSPLFVAPASPGIYPLVLSVHDGQAADTASTSVIVYDASAGFVTGGGWIDSPAGAYFADPDMAGRATFGFVSKYHKGATVPTGSTAFEFAAGDLHLISTSYEWLVVTGSDYARFKGSATINGMGDYRFMVWAGDNEPDTFSIRIWQEDEATGVETDIYDNGFDQTIGGGSIVIHAQK